MSYSAFWLLWLVFGPVVVILSMAGEISTDTAIIALAIEFGAALIAASNDTK